MLRKRLDRRTGKLRYENWDYLAMTIEEPQLPGGETLLNRHLGQTEHIKPTEARRRLQSAQVYRRSVKRLEDLKIIGYARQEWTTDQFHENLRAAIDTEPGAVAGTRTAPGDSMSTDKTLLELAGQLADRNVIFCVAAGGRVMPELERFGVVDAIGVGHVFASVDDAIAAFTHTPASAIGERAPALLVEGAAGALAVLDDELYVSEVLFG